MSYTFSDLKTEVKARSILSESGSNFNIMVGNVINTSLFRIAREANWMQLRRKYTFDTVSNYTTGTGAVTVTNNSANVTVTGATFLTDGVDIGRRIDLGGSNLPYVIKKITGETTLVVDRKYDGTTSSTQSYKIYGKTEYNIPMTGGRIAFLWHEDLGYPLVMRYATDFSFLSRGLSFENEGTPTCYRQWNTNSVISQPKNDGTLSLSSSSTSDTNISITIYGNVSGYPDYEVILTNNSDGTTAVASTKSFDAGSIERISCDGTNAGRITITSDSGNTTVAVIPVGDTTNMIQYRKVELHPAPDSVYPINVACYKDPGRLVNDTDVHELGHQFDEAIILLSVSKMNYSQSKKEGDYFLKLYLDEVKNLKKFNMDSVLTWFPRSKPPRMSNPGNVHKILNYAQIGSGGNFGPQWGY